MANHLEAKEKDYRPARLNRVIVCESLNFFWDRSELNKLKKMWQEGISVQEMAEHFGRDDPDEVLLALIHLARESEIFARKKGLR